MHEQPREVTEVIEQSVQEVNAALAVLPAADEKTYQWRNGRLAYAAAQFVAERDNLYLPADALVSLDMTVPGRMQIIKRGESTIILDGAHNEQKAAALVKTLRNQYSGQAFAMIVAVKDTKDYAKVVELLSGVASSVVATTFQVSQDTPIRSVEPQLLQGSFEKSGIRCQVKSTIEQAVTYALDSKAPYILVTGSLYAVSEAVEAVKRHLH